MLYPSEVGIASGRSAILPARIVAQALAAPVAHVEGRICQNEIGLQVFMQVVVESVVVMRADVGLDAANRKVHFGETPSGRIRFLSIDRNVANLSAVLSDELLALNEHSTGTAARVIDATLVRLDHFDEELNDTSGGIKLAALLSFRAGELPEEVLVDTSEDVFGSAFLVTKSDFPNQINELA